MSKVEVSTVMFESQGRISAQVDRQELASNMRLAGSLAKNMGLRPGETGTYPNTLELELKYVTYVASADKLAVLYSILKAKHLEKNQESL